LDGGGLAPDFLAKGIGEVVRWICRDDEHLSRRQRH
jgi:hypothetical protein